MSLGKRIYFGIVNTLAVANAMVFILLFWLLVVLALHWEGIISVDPLMVVLNHIIDSALRDFFEWLLN